MSTKTTCAPGHDDRFRSGYKTVGSLDDLISGRDSERSKSDKERIRSIPNPATVGHPAEFGELVFEISYVGSTNDSALRDQGLNRDINLLFDRELLGSYIYEGYIRRGRGSLKVKISILVRHPEEAEDVPLRSLAPLPPGV